MTVEPYKERRNGVRVIADNAVLLLSARIAQALLPVMALWLGNTVHNLELAAEDVKTEIVYLEKHVDGLEKSVFKMP